MIKSKVARRETTEKKWFAGGTAVSKRAWKNKTGQSASVARRPLVKYLKSENCWKAKRQKSKYPEAKLPGENTEKKLPVVKNRFDAARRRRGRMEVCDWGKTAQRKSIVDVIVWEEIDQK